MNRVNRIVHSGLVCGLMLLSAVATRAQQTDSTRADELVRMALDRYDQAQTTAPPVAPLPSGTDIEPPQASLTVDEAVKLALDRNLDIAVERLNPQTFDLTVAGLEASYRPAFNSTLAQNSAVQLPTSQLIGGQAVSNDISTYNFGLAQNLRWGGGTVAVGWNNRKLDSSSSFNTFNPQYNSTFAAALTQPLLRGRSVDTVRNQLVVTKLNRDISEVQLRSTITNTLANVRNSYWDLAYTIAALKVARQSLELAEKLVEDNKTRVEVGTMAPIDIVQAEAEAATRRQTLAQAEADWRTAQLALKQLIVGSTEDPMWKATIDPVDRPTFDPAPIDLEAAIRRALDQRTDLIEIRKQLNINDANINLLRNLSLPGMDVIASYGLQGIGGTRFIRSSVVGSPVVGTIPGGYLDALRAVSGRDFPNWALQLNINYPIGTSTADAAYARARVQKSQSLAQTRAVELQVATEVTNAALQIESNLKRVDASRAARELAEKRLEAEQSKFEVGMSTNFFVVQAQRDLADAQGTALRTLLDYQKSVVDFERLQQTSLTRAGITLVGGGIASGTGGATTRTTGTVGGGGGGNQ